jgi:hypothetical protein
MTYLEAWRWITSRWGTPTWTPIPKAIRKAACLRSDLGMVGFTLCTRAGAKGGARVQEKLNSLGNAPAK